MLTKIQHVSVSHACSSLFNEKILEYVTEETRKTCLHMDIIESDKMEWMKDLPQNKLNATKVKYCVIRLIST